MPGSARCRCGPGAQRARRSARRERPRRRDARPAAGLRGLRLPAAGWVPDPLQPKAVPDRRGVRERGCRRGGASGGGAARSKRAGNGAPRPCERFPGLPARVFLFHYFLIKRGETRSDGSRCWTAGVVSEVKICYSAACMQFDGTQWDGAAEPERAGGTAGCVT